MPQWISTDELLRAVPMRDAIDALQTAFARRSPPGPLRTHLQIGEAAELLLMPAFDVNAIGVKLVTIGHDNPSRGYPRLHSLYLLFDRESLAPQAIIDGEAITGLRTAAVSGLATEHLARPDATRLQIFGAGVQARAHIDAMLEVRPGITHVDIVDLDPERAAALCASVPHDVAMHVATADDVRFADIVCTCTNSRQPVFDGSLLRPGTHVNAMGAYRSVMRELDSTTLRRSRLVVEDRAAALVEAGDILIAIDEGAITADHIDAVLGDLCADHPLSPVGDRDITVFKSVGLAMEDLTVAQAAVAPRSESLDAAPGG